MSGTHLNDPVPTISVLLPVHNAELYVDEAIKSILAQTYGDFELLALDDGSTDRSLLILREYEAQDSRVHIFSRENRGLVASLNELIAKARGRYLARMDADDICMPDRFRSQVTFLDSFPDHVLVGAWVETVNAAGLPIGILRSPTSHEEIDQDHLSGHTSIRHPTAMIRRSAVMSAGCYRSEFISAEDLDLFLRLAELGKLANLPEVMLRYRLHAGSISEAKGQVQQAATQSACESAWRRRGIEHRFEAVDHWRPGSDKDSRHKFAVQYGWIAWNHGHTQTWRTYAWEALRLRPFSPSSWRLLIFGLLKSPHKQIEMEN